MFRRYRSRHHPENGVTYIVVGDSLISSGGIKYGKECGKKRIAVVVILPIA